MKKVLSALLTAVVILSATSCGVLGIPEKDSEEVMSEVESLSNPEDIFSVKGETKTDKSKADKGKEQKAEYQDEISKRMSAFVAELKDDVPYYAKYLMENTQMPIRNTMYIEGISETGEPIEMTLDLQMSDWDEIYLSMSVDDTTAVILLYDDMYYVISDEEQQYACRKLSDDQAVELRDNMLSSIIPDFDPRKAEYYSDSMKWDGIDCYYEMISTKEIGNIEVFANKQTGAIEYIMLNGTSMKMLEFSHSVDKSVFEVPGWYEQVEMPDSIGVQ